MAVNRLSLATMRVPFSGGNITATLIAVARQDPQAVNEIAAEIDPDLARLIMRLLSKDPDKRPQSVAEVSQAIEEIEQGLAAESLEASKQPSLAQTESTPQTETRSASKRRNTSSKRKRVSQSTGSHPFWSPKHARWRLALVCTGGASLVLLLAAVVFLTQTKDGAIRVEINDPDIEVAIQRTEIVLRHADAGKDVTLSPGEKTLVVRRSDFKFETDKLILKKGEMVTVRVELLMSQIQVRQGEKLI